MTSRSAAELFRIEDFDSLSILVKLRNQTSNTGAGGKVVRLGSVDVPKDPALINIRLIEFHENGISLETPPRLAAQGHIVDCDLEVLRQDRVCFSVRGKVVDVVSLENSRERLDIELLDRPSMSFELLRLLYQERQEEIDDFIQRARGGQ